MGADPEDRDRSVKGWSARNERVAGALIRSQLGGQVRCIDRGGGPVPLHDLEIWMPNGERYVIEVTQHVDHKATQTLREVQARVWQFPQLSRRWQVGHAPVVNVSRLHQELPVVLARLEAAEVQSWFALEGPNEESATEGAILHDLGVRSAFTWKADQAGTVSMILAADGGPFSHTDVLETVELHALKPDNMTKLDVPSAHKRALLIWVEAASTCAAALSYKELPPDDPRVPPFLDEVWVASASSPCTVMRWSSAAGWQLVDDIDLDGLIVDFDECPEPPTA